MVRCIKSLALLSATQMVLITNGDLRETPRLPILYLCDAPSACNADQPRVRRRYMKNPPFADKSLLGTCIQLAHATFYEALPSNIDHRAPVAPAVLTAKRARRPNALQRGLEALDNWFHRQRLASREAYLVQ